MKRNANVTASLIENFDIAESVVKELADSSGSALEENEKYINSVIGKTNQLKESVQALYDSVLDSEFLKFGITTLDILTRILTVISDVAFDNFFSGLATLGGLTGGFAFFKNLD